MIRVVLAQPRGFCAGVERDVVRAQHPRFVVRRTGREGHVLQTQDALGRQVHRLGGAARGALEEFKLRRLEVRSAGRGVVAAGADDVHDRVGVVDASLAFQVFVGVHVNPVGFELPIALADDDVSRTGGKLTVDVGNAMGGMTCLSVASINSVEFVIPALEVSPGALSELGP